MYQTRIIGKGLYRASSQGYGSAVETFGRVEEGETPMSLVNIALASCVIMCVQGYFKRVHDLEDLKVEVQSSYDKGNFSLTIALEERPDRVEEEAIKTYVDQHCRVKQLLRPELGAEVTFI